MWDAIRENARRSRLLIGLMGAILIGLGALVGVAILGPDGALFGVVAAVAAWALLLGITLYGGEQVVLFSAGAREIRKEDAPRLWNVVEEMTIASGLGRMPRIYIIDEYLQNAFATGRKPDNASIIVTAGLIRRLNRDELQGVIAHEIGHIRNLDIRFMTTASVMLGSIILVADSFRRWFWFGGAGRRGRFKGGGQVQILIFAVTMLAAILAPICAQLLYFACSRRREYLADASAARFTRYPQGLASALEKISQRVGLTRAGVPRSLAPMYIVNPLQAGRSGAGLFSTHPPTAERIRILRSMGGRAGWVDYERAYRQVTANRGSCLHQDIVGSERSVEARLPTAEPEPQQDAVGRAREVGDLLDRLVNFLLISCACGVRIKVPPDFRRDSIRCTRCGRDHEVPRAEEVAAAAVAVGAGAAATGAGPLQFRRRGTGWQSFRCRCGRVHQLSPGFRASVMTCRKCRRQIRIVNG
jgi:heat shock protein HtpX